MQIEQQYLSISQKDDECSNRVLKMLKSTNWTENMDHQKLVKTFSEKAWQKKDWQATFKNSSFTRHLKSLKDIPDTFGKKSERQKQQQDVGVTSQEIRIPAAEEIALQSRHSQKDVEKLNVTGSSVTRKEIENNLMNTKTPRDESHSSQTSSSSFVNANNNNNNLKNENVVSQSGKKPWYKRSISYSPTRILKRKFDSLPRRKNKDFKNDVNRRSNSLREIKKKTHFSDSVCPKYSDGCMDINDIHFKRNIPPIMAFETEVENVNKRNNRPRSLHAAEESSAEMLPKENFFKLSYVTSSTRKKWKVSERHPCGSIKATARLSVLPSVVLPWRREERESAGQPAAKAEADAELQGCQDGTRVEVGSPAEAITNGVHEERLVSSGASERLVGDAESKDAFRAGPNSTSSPSASPSPYGRGPISRSEWDIHRPWSETYTSECSHAPSSLSQSACRLSMEAELTGLDDHQEELQRVDEALSMPYAVTSDTLALHGMHGAEGKFQKFRKTLSLRLAKKGVRGESPCRMGDRPPPPLQTPPLGGDRTHGDDVMMCPNRSSQREEDLKSSYFKFGHPLFRTSKERKRAKLRDSRSSKCNSGDSGDSGIELASGTSTLGSDPAAPQQDAILFGSDFHGNGEIADSSSTSEVGDVSKKVLRRTRSDMSKSRSPQRPLVAGGVDPQHRQSLGRQYSSPQPIKVRPFHRLPNYSIECAHRNTRLKRSKGSTHLRRSVSQPLDLDKSFQAQVSLLKMRPPLDDDDDGPNGRRQRRRPSVGNLLSEDNSSEDDGGLSEDGEEDEEFSSRTQQGFKRGLEEEEEDSSLVFAEALWDHVSLDCEELVFRAGDLVTVVDSSDKDWWWGRSTHRSGWFPASFVRLLVNQEDHQRKEDPSSFSSAEDGESWSSRKVSLSSLSQDQVRANVINEIISTERDYVKHLQDVVEGYLRQVRKRPDMFASDTIATIFGNMEVLFHFHAQFLGQLERRIDEQEPHRACIGDCFIRNKPRFEIYSEYCNNHPSAVTALQELYQDQRYVHFFEACRLLQQMIDISIDGFLLTPVQKICKYPLQLQELLKYTKPNHADYANVYGAMQTMKEVALLVNERRRRMECLEKIATWQKGVEGWEGADLLDDSSQLIYQGEVTKGVGGSWPKEVALFLFDHQMVYCKRDLLKRNTFVYRGRINTDLCEVIDVPDDPLRSAAFHHVWKIHCLHKSKTYVFTCKTAADKTKWIQAFKRERALVAVDEASGFVASEKQKQVARMAARTQRNRPKKPRMKTHARKQVMTYAQAQLLVNKEKGGLDPRSNSLPQRGLDHTNNAEAKKKGHWFSFGGHKKSRHPGRTQKQNGFHNS